MELLGQECCHREVHLLTDSSKVSLKAVLLQIGNMFTLVPLAYATDSKEIYENTKLLLDNIKYEEFECNICG